MATLCGASTATATDALTAGGGVNLWPSSPKPALYRCWPKTGHVERCPNAGRRPLFGGVSHMAKTVLVVDDDPTQRRLIQAVLEREGLSVAHAETGEQAIDQLVAGGSADAIMLDLN